MRYSNRLIDSLIRSGFRPIEGTIEGFRGMIHLQGNRREFTLTTNEEKDYARERFAAHNRGKSS